MQTVKKSLQKGFTLLELAITMVIVAVMVMWGAPSLMGVLESQRVRSAVSELRSAFAIARFESYGQGRRIVMAKNCALTTAGCTSPPLADRSQNWSAGFQVFVCREDVAIADDAAAANARSVNANECANDPRTYFLSNTLKQDFEGFSARIRICDRDPTATNGAGIQNASSIVFSPNGNVVYFDGTNVSAAPNLDFFVFLDRGNNDVAHLLSMSGDGQISERKQVPQDINNISGVACEP